jgi:hypothetical protein
VADVVDGKFGQELAGAVEDGLGDAGEAGDVDAVGAVGAAFDDAVKKDDLVLPFPHRDVQVFHAFESLGQVGQLVVMRGEKRAAAQVRGNVLGDRPREAQAVQRAGAAADMIISRSILPDRHGLAGQDPSNSLPDNPWHR